MKIRNYALMFASASLLAACSSDEPMANEEVKAPVDKLIEGHDTGYVNIDLNLPQTGGTNRAGDPYEYGTASEYTVNNGKLIVFQKMSSEAAAAVVCVSDLEFDSWTTNTGDQAPVKGNVVAKIDGIDMLDDAAQYQAFVVLNTNGVTLPANGQTYGQWSKTAQNVASANMTTTGIYMASAPEYKSPGVVTTLVDINKANIKASAAEAAAAPATSVYVERGVAKVQLTSTADGKINDNVTVTVLGWTPDVVNTKTFPVKVVDGLVAACGNFNMFTPATETKAWGSNPAKTYSTARFYDDNTFKRVNFGMDPNFTQYAPEFTINQGVNATLALNAVAYVPENTFNIENQTQNQTTRVLIRAQAKLGTNPAGTAFVTLGTSGQTAYTEAEFGNLVKTSIQKFSAGTPASAIAVNISGYMGAAQEFALTKDMIKINDAAIADNLFASVLSDLGLSAKNQINVFANGVMYYWVRIKHFGDDQCFWVSGAPSYGINNDINNLYFLGRYGVVRNNWYTVNVNRILSLGANKPDEPGTPPDDTSEQHLNVSINILSWSKRVQNVEI